jgi:hypothetical protein
MDCKFVDLDAVKPQGQISLWKKAAAKVVRKTEKTP